MTTAGSNRISIGWVLVSYLMITGGFLIAVALMGFLESNAEWVGYGAFFLGAAFGGFFAGRASPGSTIIEPALGGVVFIASIIGLLALVPGSRELFASHGSSILATSLKIGFVSGLGGLVGGVLGERTSGPQRSTGRLRWMGLSGLISLGMLFTLTLLIGLVMLRSGSLSDSVGPFLLILTLAAFLGGAVTQSIAPEKMCLVAGSGYFVVGFVSIGLAAAQGAPVEGKTILGGLIFGGLGTIVGALGALVGWGIFGERIERNAAAERAAGGNVPPARVQS